VPSTAVPLPRIPVANPFIDHLSVALLIDTTWRFSDVERELGCCAWDWGESGRLPGG
jgi:hypothetical protein